MGVFTQVASNIKGFACKFVPKSAFASCVNVAWGGIFQVQVRKWTLVTNFPVVKSQRGFSWPSCWLNNWGNDSAVPKMEIRTILLWFAKKYRCGVTEARNAGNSEGRRGRLGPVWYRSRIEGLFTSNGVKYWELEIALQLSLVAMFYWSLWERERERYREKQQSPG